MVRWTGNKGDPGVRHGARAGIASSLRGRLLVLTVLFVLIAEVLIYFPAAAAFRNGWLNDRANAAHLAAIAAELAEDNLSEEAVRELLDGADAIGVARVFGGATELLLGGDTGGAPLMDEDRTRSAPLRDMLAVIRTLTGPADRLIVLTASLETRPDERILVILPEAPLREALADFTVRLFWVFFFLAILAGGLIYLALLFLFVRPMRKLSIAMTAFQEDPSDATRILAASTRRDEIGEAERALSAMQADVLAAIRQRERLASLGLAVAKINHDLRNVLASAQLVSDRLATSEDARTAAMGQRLVRAVDRGIRLCSEVLEYGSVRERPPAMEPVRLAPLLDEIAADTLGGAPHVSWVNAVDQDLEVSGDRESLHRLFANLFRNAAQAMKPEAPARLSVETRQAGGPVQIMVRDTGSGIPDHVRERLFTPFSGSGAPGSTGLGLSIARELASLMGGTVALEATGPEGTVFRVELMTA